MEWFLAHVGQVASLTVAHAALAAIPLLLGLLIALPLGWWASRSPRARGAIVAASGLLYTIPSLALFILMPLILGTGILDPLNVVMALTVYTVALLTRTVADALASVPPEVSAAATAMGIKPWGRLLTVELPLAVPVIASGLRVAAVSNVSIASVAALLGIGQLGSLFTDGFAREFVDPIVVGIVVCMGLAMAFDLAIATVSRLLTPWLQARS